ncbi:MAG: hypothetical protein KC427_08425 [Sulfurovum sp.]|uniref:hypothetical protein n=1 Tax=Sulfurovum sp. TaxID=1969726 RepID=UPI0028682436|nr:hypothetical protein [Sulfurovum sp.]MCO4846026.1 hypothetical protein [Sulfurovum sp.]
MKKTLFILGAVALLASPSLFADGAKSQVRTQDTAEYKEDVQHKYRYQTEEQKKYKGENQSKYQYQHRNNINDAVGSGMRSMGSSKGGSKR